MDFICSKHLSNNDSPDHVNFGSFHVTAKELASSMKPGGWLHSAVMEMGIEAIKRDIPPSAKKMVMPLRIAVSHHAHIIHVFSFLHTHFFLTDIT